MNDLRVYDRISDAVGWTPMVRLHRSIDGTASEVCAKREGSDRYHRPRDLEADGRPGKAGASLLEGLGDEEIIGCPEFDLIDEMYQVSDQEAFLATRDLARKEAIFAGGSSGAALWGVRKLAASLEQPARIVMIFPTREAGISARSTTTRRCGATASTSGTREPRREDARDFHQARDVEDRETGGGATGDVVVRSRIQSQLPAAVHRIR